MTSLLEELDAIQHLAKTLIKAGCTESSVRALVQELLSDKGR
jgi:hypothetical protein